MIEYVFRFLNSQKHKHTLHDIIQSLCTLQHGKDPAFSRRAKDVKGAGCSSLEEVRKYQDVVGTRHVKWRETEWSTKTPEKQKMSNII